MTEQEFISDYCKKSDISEQYFNEVMVAEPCHCGDESCHGWAAIMNNPEAINKHRNRYI